MVGIFKANSPFNTFLLFIYGLLLKFAFFSAAPPAVIRKNDPVVFAEFMLKIKVVMGGVPVIYPAITYLLLFTQAITLNRFINSQRLIQQPTYLPAMSYLLITSMFPEWNILTPALLVNTLSVWIFVKLNNLHNSATPRPALFNVGMLTGISAFIYLPALGFAIMIIFALIMSRPFNLAEWVMALLGIITPFYFLFVWMFLTDRMHYYTLPPFAIGYPALTHNYWPLVAVGLIITAFITGAYFVQAGSARQVVQVRKSWSLMFVFLAVSVLIACINQSHNFEYWILAIVPLSAFAGSAFFYPAKKWFPLLLHWLMVGFVIAFSYFLQ